MKVSISYHQARKWPIFVVQDYIVPITFAKWSYQPTIGKFSLTRNYPVTTIGNCNSLWSSLCRHCSWVLPAQGDFFPSFEIVCTFVSDLCYNHSLKKRKRQHRHKIQHQQQHNSSAYFTTFLNLYPNSIKYHSSGSFMSLEGCRVFTYSIFSKRNNLFLVYFLQA